MPTMPNVARNFCPIDGYAKGSPHSGQWSISWLPETLHVSQLFELMVLVPDQDLVPMVEQAMDYLDEGHSSRRTADWLSEKSGKTISQQGLSNIWKAHRSETSELLKSRKKQRRKNAPKTESEKRVKAAKRKRSDITLLKFAQVNKLSFDYSNKKMPRSRRGQSNRECGRDHCR